MARNFVHCFSHNHGRNLSHRSSCLHTPAKRCRYDIQYANRQLVLQGSAHRIHDKALDVLSARVMAGLVRTIGGASLVLRW